MSGAASGGLDLSAHLVIRAESTYLIRVEGRPAIDDDVRAGDLLVVDRALEPTDGDLVVTLTDGGLTLCRWQAHGDRADLPRENPCRRPHGHADGPERPVWGVATGIVRRLR